MHWLVEMELMNHRFTNHTDEQGSSLFINKDGKASIWREPHTHNVVPCGQWECFTFIILQIEEGDPVPDGANEAAAIAGEVEVPAAVHGTQ